MKNKILIIELLLGTLFLVGCGQPTGRSSLINYAKNEFGSIEENIIYKTASDGNEIKVIDKEYGFEYEVYSYMSEINIDATSFGSVPSKGSDFEDKYLEYFQNSEDYITYKEKYHFNIDIEFGNYIRLDFYEDNNVDVKQYLEEFIDIFQKFDNRNYFYKLDCYLYSNDKFQYRYNRIDDKIYSKEDSEIDFLLEGACSSLEAEDYRLNIQKNELTYLDKNIMNADDIPHYNNRAFRIDDTPESLEHTLVVYFMYKNEKYLVADCLNDNGYLFVTKLEN